MQAGARAERLELKALVQRGVITYDRHNAVRALLHTVPGVTEEDALTAPFLAIGTLDEIDNHVRAVRERQGISYVSIRGLTAFAPVIERLRHV